VIKSPTETATAFAAVTDAPCVLALAFKVFNKVTN
jgi:hypothetical protein